MDLNQASREALLEIIAELRQRVESLEARLSGGGPGVRMPGHKPAAKRKKPAAEEKKPRKKRQHGFGQPRMEPIGRVVHAPESCPECHTALTGGWAQRTREVIDIPVVPAEVTEHVFIARICPLCRKRRLPQDPLKGLAVGRQRFGANLVGLIVTLREEERLPVRPIQWYLRMFHQLKLSVGAIVRAVHQSLPRTRYGLPGRPDRKWTRRWSASVAARWSTPMKRVGGRTGKTATSGPPVGAGGRLFSTPKERFFLRRGRGGVVVDEVLGESFEGILVSDFYVAYHHYPGLKQRCWAHLLRDIHALKVLYPEDGGLAQWALGVQRLYAKGREWAAAGGRPPSLGQWHWKTGCWRCACLSWKTRWQCKPSSAGGLSGISRSCSSSCRTRRPHLTIMPPNGVCATW